MTQIISDSLKKIDFKKLKNQKLSELFVAYGESFISLDKLEVITKSQKNESYTIVENSRPIKNLNDFKLNYSKLCLLDDSGIYVETYNKPEIFYKGFVVPSTFESTSIDKNGATDAEKVAYGLKRKLEVEASKPTKDENAYLYVEIGNNWKFIKQSDIVWFDGTEKKTYIQALNENKDIKTLKLFNTENEEITSVYTEYEYKFPRILEKEVIDLTNNTKSVVAIDKDGKETKLNTEKISITYSKQSFVKVEVDDEKNEGNKKFISKVKTTNFTSIIVDETTKNDKNLYVSLMVKDALKSHVVMVKLADLVNEDGEEILDLSLMYGKRVKIKDGDNIIATSDPLTYEQANLRFDTIKTYQEYDGIADDNTCLRLEDGTYVKELDSVQPLSYKVAVGDSFDKYLVEQTIAGVKNYVIVDKDYFNKHGNVKGLNREKAVKLKRCDINDAECSVIQTTSKDNKIEQSAIIGDVKIDGISLPKSTQTKKELYESFKTAYKNGQYKIKDIYYTGKFNNIQKGGKRYQYTDQAYYTDYADNLTEYKALKTKDIIIKNGKIEGGSEYDVKEGIKDGFRKWSEFLFKGFHLAVAAGIFIPIVGPIASAIYGIGMMVAIPTIPIVNLVRGAIKNRTRNYTDKTEYNRTKEVINIDEQIASLLQIHTSLNDKQFEDAYAKLLNNVISLSKTTSISALNLKDGKAKVDSNNVRLADNYVKEYKSNQKLLNAYSLKIKKLNAKGKPIPVELQAEYDRLKEQQDSLNNKQVGISYGEDSRMNRLYLKVTSFKFYHMVNTLKDEKLKTFLNEVGLEADFDITRLSYDATNGLCIDGIAISSGEEMLKSKFKKDANKADLWKQVRTVVVSGCNKLEKFNIEKPNKVGLEEKMNNSEDLDAERIDEEGVDPSGGNPEPEQLKKKNNKVKYDAKINSEDDLVVILKSRPESKDRKKLIEYIKAESGVEITEEDIKETIKRINTKHLKNKNATGGASRLNNKNIDLVLTYGQQYLTIRAREIKERTMPHSM